MILRPSMIPPEVGLGGLPADPFVAVRPVVPGQVDHEPRQVAATLDRPCPDGSHRIRPNRSDPSGTARTARRRARAESAITSTSRGHRYFSIPSRPSPANAVAARLGERSGRHVTSSLSLSLSSKNVARVPRPGRSLPASRTPVTRSGSRTTAAAGPGLTPP